MFLNESDAIADELQLMRREICGQLAALNGESGAAIFFWVFVSFHLNLFIELIGSKAETLPSSTSVFVDSVRDCWLCALMSPFGNAASVPSAELNSKIFNFEKS